MGESTPLTRNFYHCNSGTQEVGGEVDGTKGINVGERHESGLTIHSPKTLTGLVFYWLTLLR